MKELLKNIWTAPASTVAGGLVALGLWVASDNLDVPDAVKVTASGLAVFFGAVYGPAKKS